MNLDEKKKFIVNFLYFSVWLTILYLIFKISVINLLPFIIAVIIAYLVQKPAEKLSQKIKIRQNICAAILSVFIFLSVTVILSLFVWVFFSQSSSLVKNLSSIESFYNQLKDFLKNFSSRFDASVEKMFDDTIKNMSVKLTDFLTNLIAVVIKKLPDLFIDCIITVVATCYIAKDYKKLVNFVKGFTNIEFFQQTKVICEIVIECFSKFIISYFLLFLLTFLELLIGFLLLGINHFLILAIVVAIVDILPILGSGAVLLPWGIVLIVKGNYLTGIGLLVLYLTITVIRNFAEPKIIGNKIGINPIFTLIFFFLGLKFGGIVGMILFPLALTVTFTYYRRKFSDNQS